MPGFFGRLSLAGDMRRFVHELRTEGAGPGREAVAVGVGVFLGCTPFYGFHLLMCAAAGWLLRLNRLKLYLAANVSNPLLAPLLILSEVQVGAWARRGAFHSLSLEAIKRVDPWSFGADLLVGSLIVGAVMGVTVGLTTWLLTRSATDDSLYAGLVRRASDRYVTASIVAWEFARGKLKGDPIYRTLVTSGLLRSGDTLVDVGCGSGLTLALLAEAATTYRSGGWPSDTPPPPLFERLIGIELRPRVAGLARRALADAATILEADVRHSDAGGCDVVLCFDVLHMMPADDQEQVLASLARQLRNPGMILVREADAGAGWSFRAVRAGNRLKAIAFGHWRQTFHFRTADEWSVVFATLGFVVERRGAGEGTPFGNVLFVLTRSSPIGDSLIGDC